MGGVRRVEQLEAAGDGGSVPRGDCFGAAALADPDGCPVNRDAPLDPTPLRALDDAVRPSCMVGNEVARLRVCEFGSEPEAAAATVALVGDSHAGHFRATIDALAAENGWHVVTMLKGSCPFADARRLTSDVNADSCEFWNRAVLDEITRRPEISIVFTSGSSLNEFVTADHESNIHAGASGYERAWSSLPATVRQIVAIRDVPRPRPDNVDCLQALGDLEDQIATAACALPRDQAVLPDPLEEATKVTGDDRVVLVDLNDHICDDRWCLTIVGNSVVYRDGHHLTATFARTLAPFLSERIDAAP
jgi:hypothetical protein